MITVIDYETGEITTTNLADEINREHELFIDAQVLAIEHAINCGKLLIKQKEQLEHGEWGLWILANCKFKPWMAHKYMLLAKNVTRHIFDDVTSIRAALLLLAESNPTKDKNKDEPELTSVASLSLIKDAIKVISDNIQVIKSKAGNSSESADAKYYLRSVIEMLSDIVAALIKEGYDYAGL